MSTTAVAVRAVGAAADRLDGPDKVRGTARYAFEQPVDRPAYLDLLQATIAAGRVTRVETSAATAEPGVLAVLTHENAPRLASTADAELAILQTDEIAYCGQVIGGVIAETPEIARHAASLVRVHYAERAHDVELRPDRDDLYTPAPGVLPGFPADSAQGDVDAALASAVVTLDTTYTTPRYDHNPMEPHATIAIWADDGLTLYLASQGVHWIRASVAELFGLDPHRVRVISPHVGGGFGSKVFAHPDVVAAVMAAQLVAGRPVKLVLTRAQMFSLVGYRSPTIQRIRLGADAGGRLVAIAHDAIAQTSKVKEFGEPSTRATPVMYAAPHRRATQRLAALDVPVATFMRAPGEATGMFALESAMDEMAIACGLDPIELRIRNEPHVHPETGLPFSSRNLVPCLREGARRFGWDQRDPAPRARRDRGWLVGTGVAAATYPVLRLPGLRRGAPRSDQPGSAATIRVSPGGHYDVLIGAADIGTGTWTALTQIAADALEVTINDIDLHIGDTALPKASTAGASSGITSWGSAIVEAARTLRARLASDHGGAVPAEGLEVTAETPDNPHIQQFAMHSFGAHFAEVRVDQDTAEVRVPRLLGVFAAGQVINPKTARSQLLGGMTMGLSMALHEHSMADPQTGQVVNHNLAEYHIATNADAGSIEAYWLDEDDPYVNPMGTKGLGELGIVGTAAAIANATHHATGIRVRDLPITLDKLLQ
jgi:xanthine dehydrogenase YagR molybdenum-binding subunit